MPWPKEHKSQARERIVTAAASAMRAKGVAGVGVAEVMADAGLTHGGFYAHFPSKADLLTEALEQASRESLAHLTESAGSASAGERLRAVVDAYLSPWHLAHADAGCPVAALGPEVARAGGAMQRRLSRKIRERLDWLRELIPGDRRGHMREEQVTGALACMVGGLILARAVGGKDGAALLEACRGFLHRALGDAASRQTRRPSRRSALAAAAGRSGHRAS